MLVKLLKHDLKKIYKFLIIFYCLSVFFAVLTRIFLNINGSFIINIIGKICSGATISMIFNILINNIMRLWIKFKNNLYDDQSYLTHTLPITKRTIYLSKIILSIITLFTSIIIIGISLFIAYYSKSNIEIIKNILIPIANNYNSSLIGIILLFSSVFLIEFINIIQVGYTGIILGHRMNNNKIAFSVLFGFSVYLVTQTLSLLIAFLIGLFNKDIMDLFITNSVSNVNTIKMLGYMCILIYTVIFIINIFINIKLLKKGVNVE